MIKYILKFGLFASLTLLAFAFISFLCVENLGMTVSMIFGFAGMILAFAFIFIAVRSYRNNELNGQISFGQAFLMGLGITFIVSTVWVLSWMLTYNPDTSTFMEDYIANTISVMEQSGQSQEVIDATVAKMELEAEKYNSSATTRVWNTYLEILPIGILFSLLAALFLFKRKKKNNPALDS